MKPWIRIGFDGRRNGSSQLPPARDIVLRAEEGQPDADSVICFVFLYLPLVPIKAIHACNWRGNVYVEVPVRWSWSLVARAFGRRWALGCLLVGMFFIVANALLAPKKSVENSAIAELLTGGAAMLLWLARSDRRGMTGAPVHCV